MTIPAVFKFYNVITGMAVPIDDAILSALTPPVSSPLITAFNSAARVGFGSQFRLTPQTNNPIPISAITSTTLFVTPYGGTYMPIWNAVYGNGWGMVDMVGEMSQALSDTTFSTAIAANSQYDVFGWVDSLGVGRCTRGPAWSTLNLRGVGANTTELTRVKGVYTNANDIKNQAGTVIIPAGFGTYLGTFQTNAVPQIQLAPVGVGSGGGFTNLPIYNYWNRLPTSCIAIDVSAPYTYLTNTVRQANGSTNNQFNWVYGILEDGLSVTASFTSLTAAAAAALCRVGFGVNSITAFTGPALQTLSVGGAATQQVISVAGNVTAGSPVLLGANYAAALERGDGVNNNTFNSTSFNTIGGLLNI